MRKQHARMLGGAASGFAIEQLKRAASGDRAASPARGGGQQQQQPSGGGPPPTGGEEDGNATGGSPTHGEGEGSTEGGGGVPVKGGVSGSERHAAWLKQQQHSVRPRTGIAGVAGTPLGFASSAARDTSPLPQARTARAASPARALSPRLQAMTCRLSLASTEASRRAQEVSREMREQTAYTRSASPRRLQVGGTERAAPARALVGGPLAASHALAEGLSPAEVYMRLASGEGKPPAAAAAAARFGGGRGGGGAGGMSPRGGRGGRAGQSGEAGRGGGGGADEAGGARSEMNVTDAAKAIQRRTRGLLGRKKGMEEKAAYCLQRVLRRWIARRRRAKLIKQSKNRSRLYGGAPPQASLRGKWAEKSVPTLALPVQKYKGGMPSPKGRPPHQRLHEHAGERDGKLKARQQEASEREERAHIATCVFTPSTASSQRKFQDVKPRIDSRWVAPPQRPQSPRGSNGSNRGGGGAPPAAAANARLGVDSARSPSKPPAVQAPFDVSDADEARVRALTGDDEWTTVAATGSAVRP